MLREIRITGVGVIDDAVLELSPGLNVLTGETGAGKTMVVSGLGLLLGERADAGLVRQGVDAAHVEGIVALPPGHPAIARAGEAGADTSDDLVLLRTVRSDGRSRAHVGGRAAPIGVLAELGELLVAVHGQADQWRLRRADQHRDLLDAVGGPAVAEALASYRDCYDALREVTTERDRLSGEGRDRARQVDALRAALERVEAVDPKPGEDTDLRAEEERLGHADGLRMSALTAHQALAGDGDAPADGAGSVLELLAVARAAVAAEGEHDEALAELGRRVAELGYLAADVAADLASYVAGIDADPARLAAVQQRRAELADLVRALSRVFDDVGQDAAAVVAWSASAAATLDGLLDRDERVDRLDARADELTAQLGVRAEALSAARRTAAAALGEQVTAELGHLAMPKAVLSVAVTPVPDPDGLPVGDQRLRAGRRGVDEVEILLAAGGQQARSVTRSASGGELSRVMLAIEVVTAGATDPAGDGQGAVPTFVFDEVDAGVGGRAALDVGARLAALAEHAQVVVVTHLAQVAAFADRHLVVRKDDSGRVTSSDVTVVEGPERLAELSRMMGGDPGSAAGLEHARDLLAQAAARRGGGALPAMP